MNRCLRILAAAAVMALTAAPVEGNDDDLRAKLPWRQASLGSIQTACAEARFLVCPSPEPAPDAARTSPLAPRPASMGTRQPSPAGRGKGGVQWGSYIGGRSFNVDTLDIISSTATLTVYQSSQLVDRQEIDNTGSLRASSRYDASFRAAMAGIGTAWNRPEDSRFSAEVRGGILFADAEIERTAVTLNTVTKTGGNDFGGSFEARIHFKPEADDPYFAYAQTELAWLWLDATRDPPELISGATIDVDTSDVDLRLFSVGGGVGFFFGGDRKHSITTGFSVQQLDVEIDRDLQFTLAALNQRQEFKGRIVLEKSPVTFDASARTLLADFANVEVRLSAGSGVLNASVRSSWFW